MISLCFEFGDVWDNNDLSQYNNLKNFQKIYIKLIKEMICVFNTFYSLGAIIFMTSINHYTTLVIDANLDNIHLKNKNIYNDDIADNSQIN